VRQIYKDDIRKGKQLIVCVRGLNEPFGKVLTIDTEVPFLSFDDELKIRFIETDKIVRLGSLLMKEECCVMSYDALSEEEKFTFHIGGLESIGIEPEDKK